MASLDLQGEFSSVDLGDERLNRRVCRVVEAIAAAPAASFPTTFNDPSQLEGFYRLVNNDKVTPDALGAPHQSQAWGRVAASNGAVLVLHDTSELTFKGEYTREWLTQKGASQSVHTHVAMAVAELDAPVVHGVVDQQFFVKFDGAWLRYVDDKNVEELLTKNQRWADAVDRVHAQAPKSQATIHVMDREADDYALWSCILGHGADFVIRAKHNRRAVTPTGKLAAALQDEPYALVRSVRLGHRGKSRPPASKKRHPPREVRQATLAIRAGTCEIRRPRGVSTLGTETLTLTVVDVAESDAPDGIEPVTWRLLTTLPATSEAESARIVDIYRKRWLIEEYFKSLKTGCAAEKRQARSWDSMVRTLTLLTPIAWRLLVLRAMSRHSPKS